MSESELEPAFTVRSARAVGVSKDRIYAMLDAATVERVGRGAFIKPNVIQPEFGALAGASVLCADATLCLTSALVHHDLSDAIPFASDIALPRGVRHPVGFSHVTWHSFDRATFSIGREFVDVGGGTTVAIYSAERTIVDIFRLAHREGSEVAHEALRRWIRRRGSTPSSLIEVARDFPKALPRIRHALEVLL